MKRGTSDYGAEQSRRHGWRKMVVYDRKTGMFAMYLHGEYLGDTTSYMQAEHQLNKFVYWLLSGLPIGYTPS